MGKLQPRSEFDVTKALKIPGAGGKAANESANETIGFEASHIVYSSNYGVTSSGFSSRGSTRMDPTVPAWCYPAFQFEKARNKRERADWDFVVPVWIAITLFCTLVQVVGFQTIASFI